MFISSWYVGRSCCSLSELNPAPRTENCLYMLGSHLELFARAKHTISVFMSIYMQRVLGHSCFPVQSVLLLSSLSVYPGTPNNYFCSCSVDRNSSCVRAPRTDKCLYMLRSHLELFACAKHTFCLHVYLHAASPWTQLFSGAKRSAAVQPICLSWHA